MNNDRRRVLFLSTSTMIACATPPTPEDVEDMQTPDQRGKRAVRFPANRQLPGGLLGIAATRSHINLGTIGYLAAVALLIGAQPATADTVSPQDTTFTVSSSNVKFTLGTSTVTCTGSSTNGITPNDSTSPGEAVCGAMSTPIFTGCRITSLGLSFGANVTASDGDGEGWDWCGTPSGHIWRIPPRGIKITSNIAGQSCTITTGAALMVTGSWSNTTSSVTFNSSLPVSTAGGFSCPSATSATFSGTFAISPALTFTSP